MRLTNGQAWLNVDPIGAMITDAILYADGQPVQPFFQNPWRDDLRPMDTLTRHLGGEWPCVPFGVTQHPTLLHTDWQCDATPTEWHQHAHGFGAHSIWSLAQQDVNIVTADISYPISSPIVRLKRTVCLTAENEITLGLEIEARTDVRIPIGLHPVLSLADAAPETALIRVAGEDTAWTFPLEVEPGRSHLMPDQRNASLSSLSTSRGTTVDAGSVPFDAQSEDLVLLTSPGGCVSLVRPDLGYRVDVQWDEDALPSCLLWLSNRGRHYAPWDGRVCAVGIEPVAAAFDLGIDHSISTTTPLARSGIRTCIELSEGEIWQTSYAISAHK